MHRVRPPTRRRSLLYMRVERTELGADPSDPGDPTMPHETRCPACGCERPGRAPDGLCPRCLMQNAPGPTSARRCGVGRSAVTPEPPRGEPGEALPETEAATGTVTRRASAPEPTATCADAA